MFPLPPGPQGGRVFGSLDEIRRRRLDFMVDLRSQFGPIARFRMGPKWIYAVSSSAGARSVLIDNVEKYEKGIGQDFARRFLGNGLLTATEATWSAQRKVVQPAFSAAKREWQLRVVRELTDEMLLRWTARPDRHAPIDIVAEVMRLTLDISWKMTFGVSVVEQEASVRGALAAVLDDIGRRIVSPLRIPRYVPTLRNLHLISALSKLRSALDTMINAVRSDAFDADIENAFIGTLFPTIDDPRALREQVLTLLFSGHETTAVALCWTLYEAATHADLWDELSNGADVQGRGLVTAIALEAMRLHPPVWVIPRRATQDNVVLDHRVPANATVVVSPYVIHRDPEIFEDPDAFSVDRFASSLSTRVRDSFMPFGLGHRQCIGKGLALAEISEVLVRIGQRVRLRFTGPPPIAVPLLTLRPEAPLSAEAVFHA